MTNACIVARGLHGARGGRRVIAGVDVEVRRGELIALTGENGSGKSTLIQLLAGVLRPERGSVERRTSYGYCPQAAALYDHLTADEHFALFARAYGLARPEGRRRADELVALFGFAKHRARQVVELSGGTVQKLNLSLALLHDPELVLLDEPYAGFDLESYGCFLRWAQEARSRGRAVVIVTHLTHERGLFDRRWVLREGVLEDAAA